MKIDAVGADEGTENRPEVRMRFSRSVVDVRMTANEAERYAYEMLDAVKSIRKIETTSSGIDTGILPS
jgi:hypothetical protein